MVIILAVLLLDLMLCNINKPIKQGYYLQSIFHVCCVGCFVLPSIKPLYIVFVQDIGIRNPASHAVANSVLECTIMGCVVSQDAGSAVSLLIHRCVLYSPSFCFLVTIVVATCSQGPTVVQGVSNMPNIQQGRTMS